MRTISIAALLSVGTFITMIVGGAFAVEDRYVSKVELVPLFQQQQQLIGDNALRLLYFELDRSMAERRRLIERNEPTPQSLLDNISRLCREIAARGGRC